MEDQLQFPYFCFDQPQNFSSKINVQELGPWFQQQSKKKVQSQKIKKNIDKKNKYIVSGNITEYSGLEKARSLYLNKRNYIPAKINKKQSSSSKISNSSIITKMTFKPTLIKQSSMVTQVDGRATHQGFRSKANIQKQLLKQQLSKTANRSTRRKSAQNCRNYKDRKQNKLTIQQKNIIINRLISRKKSQDNKNKIAKILKKKRTPKFQYFLQPKFDQKANRQNLSYANILKNGLFDALIAHEKSCRQQSNKNSINLYKNPSHQFICLKGIQNHAQKIKKKIQKNKLSARLHHSFFNYF